MDMDSAAQTLRQGGLCLFPTETFFGLGCDARNPEAVARLLMLKERPQAQGLPVIIGALEQLAQACRLSPGPDFPEPLGALALQLMERFWPGPLSLVLPAASGLAPGVPRQNSVALRLTPHPAARELCRKAHSPLVASSANLRGQSPVCQAKNLNPQLLQLAQALLNAPPAPAGGLPSTLAAPVLSPDGQPALQILREGAVPRQMLEAFCPLLPPGAPADGLKI